MELSRPTKWICDSRDLKHIRFVVVDRGFLTVYSARLLAKCLDLLDSEISVILKSSGVTRRIDHSRHENLTPVGCAAALSRIKDLQRAIGKFFLISFRIGLLNQARVTLWIRPGGQRPGIKMIHFGATPREIDLNGR